MFLRPIFVLLISYSLLIHFLLIPIHFYLFSIHCLFISFSCSFISFHFLCTPIYFLFIACSFPFHVHSFLFISFDLRNLSKFQKARISFSYQSLISKLLISSPKSIGKGGTSQIPKKWLIQGVVNKVLGLDGLFISYSILMHFLFKSYSFPTQILFISYSTLIQIPFIHIQCLSFTKVFNNQWLFLVPLLGGRYHTIPQLAVYTTYIPLIYCQLGDYMVPTTY